MRRRFPAIHFMGGRQLLSRESLPWSFGFPDGRTYWADVRFVGTVEQVEGDRVKGVVERALFVNAPNLSPGGLQHLGQSVLALDLDPQNALHHHFGLSHALPGIGRTSLRNESWG